MTKRLLIVVYFVFLGVYVSAQEKKTLTVDDMKTWNHLRHKKISPDGNFVSYETNPYKGDGTLNLWSAKTRENNNYPRGHKARFAPTSKFLAFLISPQHDSLRALKLKKVKKDKLPKDSLAIHLTENGTVKKFARVKSFTLPEKEGNWIAWQHEKELPAKTDTDSAGQDSTNAKKMEKKKQFDKNAPKSYEMVIHNPVTDKTYKIENTTTFAFSENGQMLTFISLQNDTLLRSAVVRFDTKKEQFDTVFLENGLAKKVTVDHKGNQLAFIHSADTIKEKVYSLYFEDDGEVRKIMDTLSNELPAKWTVSEHGKIYFSDNDERLFFGIAKPPKPEPKDTLLDEEKVRLDLWSWNDGKLQPEQLKKKKRELKRNYLSVYFVDNQNTVMLEDTVVRRVYTPLKGNGNTAIGYNYQPYEKIGSWEMPYYKDVYVVDVKTGDKQIVLEKIQSSTRISSSGKYIQYYNFADSCWYVYDIEEKEHRNLTQSLPAPVFMADHDYPNDPSSYGTAGWTKDDRFLLIYDEFDIWQLDPKARKKPVCITNQFGRKNNIQLRFRQLDRDAKYIDPKEPLWLSAFNKETKASGYYLAEVDKQKNPQKLILDDYAFYTPQKARKANKIIWQKASYKKYPDVWYSNMKVENPVRISETNPQQKKYKWGSVEMVKWITSEGTEEEGLLYKPENFDPNKKYPMMVYFYRLYSDELHAHWAPKPSRSIINPTFYTSNDYLVFIPNIRYKVGYPGESSYNYVVSGTVALLNRHNFIDKDHIGIQGQSWGGYEAAFIITKTDMFAAASAGAPVSNMTSAYGGIRWGSGMSRMFQYEETQSRIGGTLWEKPLHYIENSPVFYAPKVNTPLLMRHNDGDGAVPWYQGIEYFVALRRLNKPVWMLNYNDAPHNEKNKSPNSVDLSIRMKQFFDHYLKEEPAPEWMKKGIPAVKKGKTLGY